MDCVFCKIVAGEIPSQKVWEGERCIAILDLFPLNKGHVLILPRDHYERLAEIPPDVWQEMAQVALEVARGVVKAFSPDGYHLLMNNGEASGQEIAHAHLHVIPRFYDDGVKFGWRHLQYEEEEFKEYADKLRKALKD